MRTRTLKNMADWSVSNNTPFNWEVSTLLKYGRCHAHMSNLAEFGGDCQNVCGVRTMRYGVSICTARQSKNVFPGLVVKGYRKMCRTGMEVGALVNSTVDSTSVGPNCDALFFLTVQAQGFWRHYQRFILSIGGRLCRPVEIPISVHNGQRIACVSSIQPNEK